MRMIEREMEITKKKKVDSLAKEEELKRNEKVEKNKNRKLMLAEAEAIYIKRKHEEELKKLKEKSMKNERRKFVSLMMINIRKNVR